MNAQQRAHAYQTRFPDRPPLAATADWVCGTWLIGSCYRNPNKLYGAYPYGYLERVHSMFPDARRVLHVFSGGLTHESARIAAGFSDPLGMTPCEYCRTDHGRGPDGCWEVTLVDLHGPGQGRHPTWQGDLFDMPVDWHGRFDLILADPPYSTADAEKYDVPMVNRGKAIAHLRQFARTGGNLVWLDQVWPMHRKAEWKCWAQIGLVRSTNHRVRLVSMFKAVQ